MRLFVPLLAVLVLLVGAAVLALRDPGEEGRDPGSGPQDIARVSVDDLVSVPDRWFRENVLVTGEVVPVHEERFVLRGDRGAAIVVDPRPGSVGTALTRGARVTVEGTVFGLGRLQTAELERLLADAATPAALREAPTELDGVFLQALDVRTPAPS
jgi:hypothetical protein